MPVVQAVDVQEIRRRASVSLSQDWDVDPELRRRARFYHRLAPFFSVHYGVFTKRPDYVEQALTTLGSRL